MKSSSSSSSSSARIGWENAYVLILWAVFLLTWLKGFRLPNLWSANLFAFNYSQGFVRRGLLGEVARRLGGDQVFRYEIFVYFSFVLLFLTGLCLGLLIRRALANDRDDLGFKTAVLVFAASPGLVFFVHVIGYTDYIGVLAVLLLVMWGHRTRRPYALFYAIVAASLFFSLVHEGMALLLGPALVFLMACHVLRLAGAAPLSRGRWLILLVHGFAATLVILSMSSLISMIGVEELTRVQALRRYIESNADFPVRVDAFDALQRSSKENLTRLMPWYWTLDRHVIPAQQSWLAFAPGAMWLLFYGIVAIYRSRVFRPAAWLMGVLFSVATLAPQLLNLVGGTGDAGMPFHFYLASYVF